MNVLEMYKKQKNQNFFIKKKCDFINGSKGNYKVSQCGCETEKLITRLGDLINGIRWQLFLLATSMVSSKSQIGDLRLDYRQCHVVSSNGGERDGHKGARRWSRRY